MAAVVPVHADDKAMADCGAFVPGPRCRLAPTGHGPLDGLSFAVKDLIDVGGVPTGAGNPDWLSVQRPAAASAPVVDQLLAAGATLAGKTITDELAFSLEGANAHYGTPINPACPDRLPGGSSSGSAVAVAAGQVDFAIGTDTGGSVRVPASLTGVLGFRPSHGAVSLAGVVPFAPSYDTIGWFARDASTLRRVGDVLLPKAPPAPLRRLRLVRDAFALADHDAAERLRQVCAPLGVADEMTLFEGEEEQWLECYRVLQGAEIWQQLGVWIASANPRFGAAIAPRFADAAAISAADVARQAPVRARLAARVTAALDEGTALVMPTAPCIAPGKTASDAEISDFYRRALTLTSVAGHAGIPQVTLPVARIGGCPVGLSVLAPRGHDRALLEGCADWLSAAGTNP
jgi:amidase